MDRVIELAKKLKALAERGEGGEKINAENQLKKLMKLHNITIEDIEGEKTDYHNFKCNEFNKWLLIQVVSTILSDYDIYKERGKRNCIALKVTASQAIEIQGKFDFYWNAYKKEIEVLNSAFCYANDLFPIKVTEIEKAELSSDELEKHKKAVRMSSCMDAQSYRKSLSTSN